MLFITFCLCGCLAAVHALPHQEDPRDEGVIIVLKSFYGMDATQEDAETVRKELQHFNWDMWKHRKSEDKAKIINHYFQTVYIKRKAAEKQVIEQLSRQLKLKPEESVFISEADRNRIAASIPPEILERYEKENGKEQEIETKNIMVIGKKDNECVNGWKPSLPRTCVTFPAILNVHHDEIVSAKIAFHLQNKHLFVGKQLHTQHIINHYQTQVLGFLVNEAVDVPLAYQEVIMDVTNDVKQWVHNTTRQSRHNDRTYMIKCTSKSCPAAAPEIDTVVLEVTLKKPPTKMRKRRSPFNEKSEEPESQERFDINPESNPYCINGIFEQNRCCLMNFTIFLQELWSNIIEPKSLNINYCAGGCTGYSKPRNTHSHIVQTLIHSHTRSVLNNNRDDLRLCCAPNRYRDFNLMVVEKEDTLNVKLMPVTGIAALGCACA